MVPKPSNAEEGEIHDSEAAALATGDNASVRQLLTYLETDLSIRAICPINTLEIAQRVMRIVIINNEKTMLDLQQRLESLCERFPDVIDEEAATHTVNCLMSNAALRAFASGTRLRQKLVNVVFYEHHDLPLPHWENSPPVDVVDELPQSLDDLAEQLSAIYSKMLEYKSLLEMDVEMEQTLAGLDEMLAKISFYASATVD